MIIKHMAPTCGWDSFKQHEELEAFLWNVLRLRENNEGEWAYMNFTSSSSIWELAVDGDVIANVILENGVDDKVSSLSISMRSEEFIISGRFNRILKELNENFKIYLS